MVRESEWTYDVNLGGIAGAEAFVPCVWARAFFVFLHPFRFGETKRPSAARTKIIVYSNVGGHHYEKTQPG